MRAPIYRSADQVRERHGRSRGGDDPGSYHTDVDPRTADRIGRPKRFWEKHAAARRDGPGDSIAGARNVGRTGRCPSDAACHRVSAPCDAQAQCRWQYPLCAACVRRRASRNRTAELAIFSRLVGLEQLSRSSRSPTVGRRTAAPRACARARPRPRSTVPGRADRESRSRRHQGDRGYHPRGEPARHQGGDGDP